MCTRGFLSQLDTQRGWGGESIEEVGHGEAPALPLTLFFSLLRLWLLADPSPVPISAVDYNSIHGDHSFSPLSTIYDNDNGTE